MAIAKETYSKEWLEAFKATFHYDPITGRITYKILYNNKSPGSIADAFKHTGYRNGKSRGTVAVINFKNIRVRSHRAAIFLMTGEFPPYWVDVDHTDGDTTNNTWTNIRIASKSQNMCNAKLRVDNTTGVKGVSKTPFDTYAANLSINGVYTRIGTFKTLSEAEQAINEARKFHHKEFANHG